MICNTKEFEIETDEYFFRVQMEYGDETKPGISLNGHFFPMHRPDEAKDAMMSFLDEVTQLAREDAYAAGHRDGRKEGWAEGYDDGVDDGVNYGKEIMRNNADYEAERRIVTIVARKNYELKRAFIQGQNAGPGLDYEDCCGDAVDPEQTITLLTEPRE